MNVKGMTDKALYGFRPLGVPKVEKEIQDRHWKYLRALCRYTKRYRRIRAQKGKV